MSYGGSRADRWYNGRQASHKEHLSSCTVTFAFRGKPVRQHFALLPVGYSGIDLVKDIWLVNEAFPSLPSGFASELDAALVFSPLMLHLESSEESFLCFIKYPPLALPNEPLRAE